MPPYIRYKLSTELAPVPKKGTDLLGFSGLVGRPNIDQLLAGYRNGFYPFSHLGPLKWWSSNYRMVLFFDEAHFEKHTRGFLRNNKFSVTFDKSFQQVLDGCAAPRPDKLPLTWITPKIKKLFLQLHEAGYAHSVEVWDKDGKLAGGLFGVAAGRVFLTESQFYVKSGASKVAFAVLNRHLAQWGFAINDGKDWTQYLDAHGFRLLHHDDFMEIMHQHSAGPSPVENWEIDENIEWQGWQGELDCQYPGKELAPFEKTTGQIVQAKEVSRW